MFFDFTEKHANRMRDILNVPMLKVNIFCGRDELQNDSQRENPFNGLNCF